MRFNDWRDKIVKPTRSIRRQRWEKHYAELIAGESKHLPTRMRVHAMNLGEYLSRWDGFYRLDPLKLKQLLEGDLFLVVEAVSETVNREIVCAGSKLDEAIRATWQDYWDALERLKSGTSDPEAVQRAFIAFDEFKKAADLAAQA